MSQAPHPCEVVWKPEDAPQLAAGLPIGRLTAFGSGALTGAATDFADAGPPLSFNTWFSIRMWAARLAYPLLRLAVLLLTFSGCSLCFLRQWAWQDGLCRDFLLLDPQARTSLEMTACPAPVALAKPARMHPTGRQCRRHHPSERPSDRAQVQRRQSRASSAVQTRHGPVNLMVLCHTVVGCFTCHTIPVVSCLPWQLSPTLASSPMPCCNHVFQIMNAFAA